MHLILFRHATAEEFGSKPDHDRELIAKGHQQVQRAAAYVALHELQPDVVLTSPVTRAKQSAEELCATINLAPPSECRWLSCGASPDEIIDELAAYTDFEKIMIVGHEPDFSQLANALIGASGRGICVKKASLIGIDMQTAARGTGELQYAIPNKLLKISAEFRK